MLIGKRLREARKAHNLSAEQLGNMIGVTKAAVSLYENEKRNPKIETLIEIMYALGVSSDYLLGADKFVELKDPTIHYETLTNEEMMFINELRKDKIFQERLLSDPKEGIKIIKNKI